jgi:hypothetical protein
LTNNVSDLGTVILDQLADTTVTFYITCTNATSANVTFGMSPSFLFTPLWQEVPVDPWVTRALGPNFISASNFTTLDWYSVLVCPVVLGMSGNWAYIDFQLSIQHAPLLEVIFPEDHSRWVIWIDSGVPIAVTFIVTNGDSPTVKIEYSFYWGSNWQDLAHISSFGTPVNVTIPSDWFTIASGTLVFRACDGRFASPSVSLTYAVCHVGEPWIEWISGESAVVLRGGAVTTAVADADSSSLSVL